MAEPVSKCGACGQSDTDPKHQVAVGFNNEHTSGELFHPHDFNREGCIYYHFDCPSEWHDLRSRLGQHEDAAAQAQLDAVIDRHEKIIALARSGVKGDELRARIQEGNF